MDEKLVREMVNTLKDVQEKVSHLAVNYRGPVADPGPEWFGRGPVADPAPDWMIRNPRWRRIQTIMGPVADPGPELMLDKSRLAQIKVHKIDQVVLELKNQIESLQLEKKLLVEEYKIKG